MTLVTTVETMWVITDAQAIDWEAGVASQDARHWAVVTHEGDASRVVADGVKGILADEVNMLVLSANGEHLAYRAHIDNDDVVVFDGIPGPAYDAVEAILFSPDSKHIAYLAEKDQRQSLVLDGRELPSITGTSIVSDTLLFSPDGTKLAYAVEGDKGYSIVVNGKPGNVYDMLTYPVFSPDSQHIAYTAWPIVKQIGTEVLPVAGQAGNAVVVLDGVEMEGGTSVSDLVFSPDSQHFAFSAMRDEQASAIVDGKEMGRYEQIAQKPPIFSPDSRHVAYVANNGDGWFVAVDGKAGPVYEMVDSDFVVFSSDYRIGYAAARDNKWFVVVDGAEMAQHEDLFGPFFSPDGLHMAYLATDGTGWFMVNDSVPGVRYDSIIPSTVLFDNTGQHLFYVATEGENRLGVMDTIEGPPYIGLIRVSRNDGTEGAASGSYSYLATADDSNVPGIEPARIERVTLSYAPVTATVESGAQLFEEPAAGSANPVAGSTNEVTITYPFIGQVNRQANLRAGPGTDNDVIGSLAAQSVVTVVGADPKGEWYQLDSKGWIAQFLVNHLASGTAEDAAKLAEQAATSGSVKWHAREYSESVAQYDVAIALDPGDHGYYNNRALAKAGLGDYQEALADLETVERLEGRLPDGFLDTRAYIYLKMGANQQAVADYWELVDGRKYQGFYTELGLAIAFVRSQGQSSEILGLMKDIVDYMGQDAYHVASLDPELADLVTWARAILQ